MASTFTEAEIQQVAQQILESPEAQRILLPVFDQLMKGGGDHTTGYFPFVGGAAGGGGGYGADSFLAVDLLNLDTDATLDSADYLVGYTNGAFQLVGTVRARLVSSDDDLATPGTPLTDWMILTAGTNSFTFLTGMDSVTATAAAPKTIKCQVSGTTGSSVSGKCDLGLKRTAVAS